MSNLDIIFFNRHRLSASFVLLLVSFILPQSAVSEIATVYKYGEGLWTTEANVNDRADIALDIGDMASEQFLLEGVMRVYSEGRNALKHNQNHTNRILKEMDEKAPEKMDGEFTFTMTKTAFDDKNFLTKQIENIYEKEGDLESDDKKKMIGKTVLVSNLWNHVVHLLYESVKHCQESSVISADEDDGDGGAHSIDEAAAYYIGADQKVGDRESGHSLYNLAERGRYYFGTQKDGQAKVNVNIITLLRQAKDIVTLSNFCHDEGSIPLELRNKVDVIISQMIVPLVQLLIHHMHEYAIAADSKPPRNAQLISVFAKAVVPQVYACSPTTYNSLKNYLYDWEHDSFMNLGFNTMVAKLQSVYECLGITCKDVGSYRMGTVAQCTDPVQEADSLGGPQFDTIAGYQPTTNVRPHSMIDLDVYQIGILMENGAHDEAAHIYENGKNSRSPNLDTAVRSLQHVSRSSEYIESNLFEIFQTYFKSDDYSNISITRSLANGFPNMTDEQRKIVATNSAVYLDLTMYSMGQMWKTQKDCVAGKRSVQELQHTWDQAAAFFIGSLEGPDKAGSADHQGQLHFSLNRKMCKNFDMCTEYTQHHSKLNDWLIDAFNKGTGQINEKFCNNLHNTIIGTIEPMLVAGLFQGLLSSSYDLRDLKPNNDGVYTQKQIAENYIYALAVVPLVDKFYPEGADVLNKNSINISDSRPPMQDGYQEIFKVVKETISHAKTHTVKLDCTHVGTFKSTNMGVCSASEKDSEGNNGNDESPNTIKGSTSGGVYKVAVSTITIIFGLFSHVMLNL